MLGVQGAGALAGWVAWDLELDLFVMRISYLAILAVLFGMLAVLVTAAADRPQVVEAIRLGARGLVLKDSATVLLAKCIRAVAGGEYWLGHDRVPDLVEALRGATAAALEPTPAASLTRRELEVIAGVLEGASNRDIALRYGLSEQTVKNHLSHIFDKVGVSNRLELALYAVHHKLADRLS